MGRPAPAQQRQCSGPAGGGCRSRASPDIWRVTLLETGSTAVRSVRQPLTVVFELHRRDIGGLVHAYATEGAALAFVRDVIRSRFRGLHGGRRVCGSGAAARSTVFEGLSHRLLRRERAACIPRRHPI